MLSSDEMGGFVASAREVLGGRHDQIGYDKIVRVLVAHLADGGSGMLGLGDAEWIELLRVLVLQECISADPPLLHTVVANYQSGGHREILAAVGEALGPTLAALVADGRPSKNVVLMLLLVRDHIGGHVDQATITRHHLASVGSFSRSDLSLPYSNAFTSAYDRNCDDLRALLSGARGDPQALPLVHRLVVEWITGLETWVAPEKLIAGSEGAAATREDAAAAGRSLAVRHLGREDMATSAVRMLGGDALGSLFEHLGRAARDLPPSPDASTRAAIGRLEHRPRQAVRAGAGLVAGRIGMRPRRRPRIAICVSGQLRGYETTFDTWRRTLLRVADCRLFVHTWSRIGRSTAEGFRTTLPFAGPAFLDAYREVALRQGFDEVKARYPALFTELGTSGTVTSADLMAHYDTEHVVVEDDEAAPHEAWTNQQKMHAKIERAFDLLVDSGWEPDLIVRIRPDKPIRLTAFGWGDLLEVCGRSATILADAASSTHYAQLVIGDQFAIGSPASMAVYSRTWSTYPLLAEAGLFACPEEYSGHSSLAQVCWTHRVDVRRAPIRFGELQEASPLSSNDIRRCLRIDAEGRHDDADLRLLRAVDADIASG